MINLETWRGLKEKERDALTACGELASERGVQLSREQADFHRAILRDNGVVVEKLDDEVMIDFVETVGKAMIAKWLKMADENSADAVRSFSQTMDGK